MIEGVYYFFCLYSQLSCVVVVPSCLADNVQMEARRALKLNRKTIRPYLPKQIRLPR